MLWKVATRMANFTVGASHSEYKKSIIYCFLTFRVLFHEDLQEGYKGCALAECKNPIKGALSSEGVFHYVHGCLEAAEEITGFTSIEGVIRTGEPPSQTLV